MRKLLIVLAAVGVAVAVGVYFLFFCGEEQKISKSEEVDEPIAFEASFGEVQTGWAQGSLPSAEELFESHLKVVGGRELLLEVENVRIRGTSSWGDRRFELTNYYQVPNLNYWILESDPMRITGGFDGTVNWVERGAEIFPDYNTPIEEELMDADPQFDAGYARYFEEMSTIGVVARGGETFYQVEAFTTGGSRELHYFSTETGVRGGMERARSRPDGTVQHCIHTYEDYREFDGLQRFTFHSIDKKNSGDSGEGDENAEGDGNSYTVEIRTYEFNVEDVPDIVAPEEAIAASMERNVSGRVSLDGEPAPGAVVIIVLDGEEHRKMETVCDEHGEFFIRGVRGIRYRLTARDDLAKGVASGNFPGSGDVEGVSIPMEIGTGVRGVVSDADGEPIAGVSVDRDTKTDLDGRFEKLCQAREPGRYGVDARDEDQSSFCVVTFSHKEYQPQCKKVTVVAGEWAEVDMVFEARVITSGVVVDEGGEIISGVSISASPLQEAKEAEEGRGTLEGVQRGLERLARYQCRGRDGDSETVTSDEHGNFEISSLHPGKYRLAVNGRGEQEPLDLELPARDVRVVLKGRGRIRGTVIDGEGEPVSECRVWVSAKREPGGSMDWSSRVTISTETDGDGGFEFSAIPGGDYQIEAVAADRFAYMNGPRVKKEVRVSSRVVDVVLQLPLNDLSITGTVVDSQGKPVKGVMVRARKEARNGDAPLLGAGIQHAMSVENGDFELKGLARGTYELSGRQGYRVGRPESEAVRAKAGDSEVKIVVPAVTTYTGRVVDPDGEPVATFTVSSAVWDSVRDAGGNFSVKVPQDGEPRLRFSSRGFRDREIPLSGLSKGGQVDLGEIQLERSRRLTGRVVNASDGTPVAGARLITSGAPAQTDEEGEFELVDVPDSRAEIDVMADGYLSVSVSVGDGEQRIVIEIGGGATVIGRVFDLEGEEISGAELCLNCDNGTNFCLTTGERRRGVPEGSCTVTGRESRLMKRASYFFEQQSVDIPGSGEIVVEARASDRYGTLKLTIKGDEGSPVLVAGKADIPATISEMRTLPITVWKSRVPVDGGNIYTFDASPGQSTLMVIVHSDEGIFGIRRDVVLSEGEETSLYIAVDLDEAQEITSS